MKEKKNERHNFLYRIEITSEMFSFLQVIYPAKNRLHLEKFGENLPQQLLMELGTIED